MPLDQGKLEIVGGVGDEGEAVKGGEKKEGKRKRLSGLFKRKGEQDEGGGKGKWERGSRKGESIG